MPTQSSPAKRVQKQPVIERGRPVPHVYYSVKSDGGKVYLVHRLGFSW
jgi:hypothetical protein